MSRFFVRPAYLAASSLLCAALVACANSTGTAPPTATPSPAPGATSNIATGGIAYIPDGGNAPSAPGIQVVHFLDTSSNLLTSPAGAPPLVHFPGSVGPFAISTDGLAALTAMTNGSKTFTQLQDVFGATSGNLVPVGVPYDTTVVPTPVPSTTPAPNITPTLSDVTGLAVLENVSGPGFAVGLAVGNGAAAGVVGVKSLTTPPLRYAQTIPFNSPLFTVTPPPAAGPRNNIIVNAGGTEALVRGPSDLIAFQISPLQSGGDRLDAVADSLTLGTPAGVTLRGRGGLAFDPAADAYALEVQAPASGNALTLLRGLPATMNVATTVQLGSRPHAVAWTPNGSYAAVAADGGYYIVSVTASPAPALTVAGSGALFTPPPYTGCSGVAATPNHLTAVTSVAVAYGYLVLYGRSDDAVCAGGNSGALIAIPFPVPGATASPTPAPGASTVPSVFIQKNLSPPGVDQDYMVVR